MRTKALTTEALIKSNHNKNIIILILL